MLKLNMMKIQSGYLRFLVLLILTLGPAQSSWCFHTGDTTFIIPDTLITDCHPVPSVCLTSTNKHSAQGEEAAPNDCNECLDLSFEEVASLCIQDSISDIVFVPGISYSQPTSVLFGDAKHSHSFITHVKRPLKANLNLHRSIQSTVLII
jgi:hypothetical protein